MNYKGWILKFLGEIEDNDVIFLSQIYTIIKKHVERRRADKKPLKGNDWQPSFYLVRILDLVLNNHERAVEIYYLLLGFLEGDL